MDPTGGDPLWGANTTSEPGGEREVAASGSSGRFEEWPESE
mgnify:CR=1 FL=1